MAVHGPSKTGRVGPGPILEEEVNFEENRRA